jgi:hypothetical protein
LIQNLNLSYNDLPSTAIDQEGTMKSCGTAEDKKRKRTMPVPHGLHVAHRTTVPTSIVLGQLSAVSAAVTVVQSYSFHSIAAGGS